MSPPRRALAAAACLLLAGGLLGGCRGEGWKPNRNRAPVGQGRNQYTHLEDKGDVSHRGGILDLERGYYSGDLTLSGTGMEKRGAGVGETVVDGNVTIEGNGWKLTGMTIRGDVTIKGDENNLRQAKVLGKVTVEYGRDNTYKLAQGHSTSAPLACQVCGALRS